MRKCSVPLILAIALASAPAVIPGSARAQEEQAAKSPKSVLIVFHSGTPPYTPTPPLDAEAADALTQPTTKNVNVRTVAGKIRESLEAEGVRVTLLEAEEVRGPGDFLPYDGIVFGTPTWFSNVAYPVKKLFDEHLIRIYEHREGRLNDKALAGFVTVMERGESGPNCLRCLTWGIEHLSTNIVEGVVVNTGDEAERVKELADGFAARFAGAMK